jgi:formate transporter
MYMPPSTQHPASADSFLPGEVARRIEAANVQRATLPIRSLLLLGLLGGLYIAFGGALATLVLTDNGLGFGLGRLTGGLAFSLGLIMLVVAGGELFTGNNLMVVAYASRKISGAALLRNWVLAYAANAAGAILLAFAIHLSGVLDGNTVKATAIRIAEAKAQLDTGSAFLRGILCNMLVCLAVWLSVAARSVEGKAIAIAFPISAFVALGFEHCIANFYLLPIGMLSGAQVTAGDFLANIVPVTLGNTLGGVLVAAAYYAVYLGNTPSRDRHNVAGETAVPAKTIWRVSGSAGWPAVAARDAAAKSAELPRPPAEDLTPTPRFRPVETHQ